MLMTSLRYLALCPCPRCLLLKSRIPLIGSKTDLKQRLKLARVDTIARRRKIERARGLLFQQGVNITSKRIEDLLQSESLVPTWVSTLLFPYHPEKSFIIRTLSRNVSFRMTKTTTSIKCSYQTYFMSSNWVFGRRCLPTLFGSSTLVEEIESKSLIIGEFSSFCCQMSMSTDTTIRYRQIPTFWRGTIRRFDANVSGMKKLAARDWEDLLQVCQCSNFFSHLKVIV